MKRPKQTFTAAAMAMLRGLPTARAAGVLAFAWALHRGPGNRAPARRRIFTAEQWREDRRQYRQLTAEITAERKGGGR